MLLKIQDIQLQSTFFSFGDFISHQISSLDKSSMHICQTISFPKQQIQSLMIITQGKFNNNNNKFMYNTITRQNRSLTIDPSPAEWDGARSQRFKKGKRVFASKDLINNWTNMPIQTIQTGRHHYANEFSQEYQFRRPKREVHWEEHWHPRTNQIKTFDFNPTSPPPRREKLHVRESHYYNPESRLESLKTSFMEKHVPTNEYGVEDRMQRKVRVDSLQLKKTYYKNLNIFKRPEHL